MTTDNPKPRKRKPKVNKKKVDVEVIATDLVAEEQAPETTAVEVEVVDTAEATIEAQEVKQDEEVTVEADQEELLEEEEVQEDTPVEKVEEVVEEDDLSKYYIIESLVSHRDRFAEALRSLHKNEVRGEEADRARRIVYNGILLGITSTEKADFRKFMDRLLAFMHETSNGVFHEKEVFAYGTRAKGMSPEAVNMYMLMNRMLLDLANPSKREIRKKTMRWSVVFESFTGPNADLMRSRFAEYFGVSQ